MPQHFGLVGALSWNLAALFLVCLPAIVAFWMGRGPWMVCAFAFSVLTIFPLSFVTAAWDFGRSGNSPSSNAYFLPLGAWLLSWLFAGLAIRERHRRKKEDKRKDPDGDA
jgi:hypothetical protein